MTAMSHTIKDLRALSDVEIIELHDQEAGRTSVGVNFYLDELSRRETLAAMKSAHRLSMAAIALSTVGTLAAVLALIIR